MNRVGAATALTALFWAPAALAQVTPPAPDAIAVGDWKLVPVLEARLRGEYRSDLDGKDRGLLTERARLGLEVTRGPVEGRVVLQDARVWDIGTSGDFVTGPTPVAATDIYEAWGEAHTAGDRPSYVRIGRQEIAWGEGRSIGASDWSATGRSLDAVRGHLAIGDWDFDLFGSILEDAIPLTASGGTTLLGVTQAYGELTGARIGWAIDPLFAVELFNLSRFAQTNPLQNFNASVQGETDMLTLRLHGDAHGWAWAAEGAYEFGRADSVAPLGSSVASNANPRSRSAWATAGHVGYTFDHASLRPSIGLGGSAASGDDGKGVYKGFDPILPDVHTWYGAMDLITWSNEVDANARVAIVPWTDAAAVLEYRYARLAQAGGTWTTGYLNTLQGVIGSSAELGHEVDANLAWSPWVPVELRAGYSVFVLGDGAKELLAGAGEAAPALSHYAYLQATLRVP